MRMFTFFALALAGTAILTDDAMAFGRRRKAESACCACGGTGYAGAGYGGGMAYSGGMSYGAGYASGGGCCGSTGMTYGGYGANGAYGVGYGPSYYPGVTYPGGMYPGGVSPAGYNSPYIPAGAMPMPAGGTKTVPTPMPDK